MDEGLGVGLHFLDPVEYCAGVQREHPGNLPHFTQEAAEAQGNENDLTMVMETIRLGARSKPDLSD